MLFQQPHPRPPPKQAGLILGTDRTVFCANAHHPDITTIIYGNKTIYSYSINF